MSSGPKEGREEAVERRSVTRRGGEVRVKEIVLV